MFDLDVVRKQLIAQLNLSVRDSAGVATYSTTTGDASYPDEELIRNCQTAVTQIMQAICETDGNPDRELFTTATALTHETVIPRHTGSIGIPRITPYSGCSYTMAGKRKSVEEIQSYRANPNNIYSQFAHNVDAGGYPCKLAGNYALDGETFYFTGYSAVSDLADFDESDYTLLPDKHYPLAIDLAIAASRKDGDVSDVFTAFEQRGAMGLALIRGQEFAQPSMKAGNRDSPLK